MEFVIKRENKEYNVHIGIDAEGNSTLYLEDVLPDELYQQKTRRYITELKIVFDRNLCNGNVASIATQWGIATVSNSGLIIPKTEELELMITSTEDIKVFTLMLQVSNPILMSALNGHVRSLMGFNHFPVFNPDGTIKQLTSFEQSTAPTWDYGTWEEGDELPESIVE